MTMDISKVFKANVKAIRMSQQGEDNSTADALNEQILGKTTRKKRDEASSGADFAKTAKNIVSNITMLKNFLNENKRLYLQPDYLISGADSSSSEWQKFEDDSESIIKKCAETIRQLRDLVKPRYQKSSAQQREHLDNVFFLLDKYLKDVCKLYSEQKAIRVRRIVEKKNYSTLSTELIKSIKPPARSQEAAYVEELEKNGIHGVNNNNFENELSAEELQAFEQENEKLFEELSVDTEEIKKIESQVIEVSKLTQIFAEKIVSQSATIEHVQKTAVDINSDLSLGNENVKEAMKKNASFRLWVLFIIIVLSLTLLFLDWYND